ncbi:MAG: type II toxin-antitoxin system RelE/ParE family toxin [Candidatus Margulisbacteria bacterium]|jgi:plasmid stabilization system protein ParE|nr:type II toxin-antitoxin system RelE/ParE family toxin [Candidatus Margulisiibacteriota bacterium]
MAGKKLKLQILPAAQQELEEIAAVHLRLVGANSARKITDKIYHVLEHLLKHPNIGLACSDEVLKIQGYRILICGNYLCIYRLIEDIIFIYHIADGRTDYPKLFSGLC